MSWTTTTIAQAAEYWRSGLSSGQIATLMGVTRSSIAGLINRNRDKFVSRRADQPATPEQEQQKAAVEPVITRKSRDGMTLKQKREACRQDAAEDAKLITNDAKAEYDQSRMPEALELHDLSNRQCHWPVNNGSPFLFCAAQTDGGKYCQHHHTRMYYRAPRGN